MPRPPVPGAKTAVIAAAGAGFVSTFFHGLPLPWPVAYNDVMHLSPVAFAAGWPYLDRPVEYPVLTGLTMRFLGWLGGTPSFYYALTAAVLTVAAAVCAWLIAASLPPGRSALRWSLAPSLLFFLVFNWDALAVLCAVAALYLAGRRRPGLCGAALALGFCFKLYPALYLAPMLVHWRREWKSCLLLLLAFAATVALINLPFALKNYHGWAYCFTFNFAPERLPNPDSIWSVARYFFRGLSGGMIGRISSLIFFPGLAYLLWCFRDEGPEKLCAAATLLLLLTAKFFSPQYALWLLPFLALIELPAAFAYGFELANIAVLLTILQYLLGAQTKIWYEACAVFVLLRHACLAGLLAAL